MQRNTLLYGGAITCLLVSPALAQDAPIPAGRTTIETVVVTAERREARSQDVPIALSAIGGDMLDSMAISDVATLGQRVPNLRFATSRSGGEHTITMRGMTSDNSNNGGDAAIAYSVDGVVSGRSAGVDPEMFDIQTIEVLRGPQGTLYGRNSIGGSINIITNKPTDELSGHVDALIGDYNARIFRGWANVPLYDCGECKVLARIVGVSANHDGYQKNLSRAPGATHNSDGQNYDMMRGHLLFQFNNDVDLLLSAFRSQENAPNATKTQWGGDLGYRDFIEGDPNKPNRFAGQTWYDDPRVVEKDYPETFRGVVQGMSATLNWDLGGVKLTSITGRQKTYMNQSNDADGSNLNMGKSEGWQITTAQWSEELRLASNNQADPLQWIAGAFYFRENTRMDFPFSDTGVGFPQPLGANLASTFNLVSVAKYRTVSWALFGQADYDLGKTSANIPLTITLGLRYTSDKKQGWQELSFWLPGIPVPPNGFLAAQTRTEVSDSWRTVTGKFGLAYKFSPDVMGYASASRGYLSGGFFGSGPYDPAYAWNYEVGLKSQFMDNRVQFNTSVFWMDVKDVQVRIQDFLGSRLDNADGSTVRGIEAELIAIPVDGLRLELSGMFQQAKYKDYITNDGRHPVFLLENNKGNRLVNTPRWTLSGGAEYAFETEAGTFTPRADFYWSSDVYFTPFNDIRARQPSHVLVNLGLKWTDIQNKYQIDLFARNIFDKDVIGSAGTQSGSFGYGHQVSAFSYRSPRTIGARFGVNF